MLYPKNVLFNDFQDIWVCIFQGKGVILTSRIQEMEQYAPSFPCFPTICSPVTRYLGSLTANEQLGQSSQTLANSLTLLLTIDSTLT